MTWKMNTILFLNVLFIRIYDIYILRNITGPNPSVFKLVQLLSVQNRKELCNIGKYLKHALYVRSQYM